MTIYHPMNEPGHPDPDGATSPALPGPGEPPTEYFPAFTGQIVYVGLNGQGQIIGVYADEAKAQANTNYITACKVIGEAPAPLPPTDGLAELRAIVQQDQSDAECVTAVENWLQARTGVEAPAPLPVLPSQESEPTLAEAIEWWRTEERVGRIEQWPSDGAAAMRLLAALTALLHAHEQLKARVHLTEDYEQLEQRFNQAAAKDAALLALVERWEEEAEAVIRISAHHPNQAASTALECAAELRASLMKGAQS